MTTGSGTFDDMERRIRGTLSKALECPLTELPRAARGERGRWEDEAEAGVTPARSEPNQ